MDQAKQIRANQKRIMELTASMSLWLTTPHAQKTEVRSKIIELQDRTLFRLQQLEIEGQKAKIENMEKVVSLLKSGV